MAKGGKYKSPILAAMKLNAQTTTRMPIEAAIAARRGARPLGDSIFTVSSQSLFANRELLDEVDSRLEPYPGAGGNADGPLWGDRNLGRNDVLRPIALAGRHVARKREVRQRG